MKKKYISPTAKTAETGKEEIMAASGVSSSKGISYGGVDEEGTKEAESRRDISDLWDE